VTQSAHGRRMTAMIDIGNGLAIDRETAEMVVVDRARLESGLARSSDPCDRAVAAMVTGCTGAARKELEGTAPSLRRNALLAEVSRLEGDPDGAVNLLEQVLDSYEPQGLRLAVVLQHLAKAEYASGRHADAVAHLNEALALRRELGAPPDQVASTELMLDIALATRRPHSDREGKATGDG